MLVRHLWDVILLWFHFYSIFSRIYLINFRAGSSKFQNQRMIEGTTFLFRFMQNVRSREIFNLLINMQIT